MSRLGSSKHRAKVTSSAVAAISDDEQQPPAPIKTAQEYLDEFFAREELSLEDVQEVTAEVLTRHKRLSSHPDYQVSIPLFVFSQLILHISSDPVNSLGRKIP